MRRSEEEARYRYQIDPTYHKLVTIIEQLMQETKLSPNEIHDAVNLAADRFYSQFYSGKMNIYHQFKREIQGEWIGESTNNVSVGSRQCGKSWIQEQFMNVVDESSEFTHEQAEWLKTRKYMPFPVRNEN